MQGECPSTARAEDLRGAVRRAYRLVVAGAEGRFPYPVGRGSAQRLGYEEEWLDAAPADVVARFVGVGNPFAILRPRSGDRVLDVGCGCGLDVFVAGHLAGRAGRAVGIDITPEMLELPRRLLGRGPLGNLEFLEADVESLPFDDGEFDLVISNGALNLAPDKDRAFRELHRVLRPGGTFAAADLLVTDTVPSEVLQDMDAWST